MAVCEAPVEVSLITNDKRCFINLLFKVNPKEFNRKKPPKYIADYLASMRTTVNSIITEMQVHYVPLTAETLRQYLKNGGFKSYTVGDLFDDFLKIAKARVGLETNQDTYRCALPLIGKGTKRGRAQSGTIFCTGMRITK